ncbi:MAG: DUF2059 domain-containing protein [Pseudomonadota bacterium]
MPLRFLRAPLVACLALTAAPLALFAESVPVQAEAPADAGAMAARMAALSDTLMMGRVMQVMRDEGIDYGTSLQDDLFPGGNTGQWQAAIEAIYDTAAMRARFDAAMAAQLGSDEAALTRIEAFFGSATGQRILTLEIDARAAMMDEAIEDAAKVTASQLAADRDPLIAQVERLAQAGDLIEMNVAGALTSNLAFYKGMAEVGAFEDVMTEAEMLAQVWGQEADIRKETEGWLMPYLTMAYKPLPPGDLDAYIAFSESPEGRRMNAAMFAAFDTVFSEISLDLGRAAARQMQGDDI